MRTKVVSRVRAYEGLPRGHQSELWPELTGSFRAVQFARRARYDDQTIIILESI
jgi:hypothetical protein